MRSFGWFLERVVFHYKTQYNENNKIKSLIPTMFIVAQCTNNPEHKVRGPMFNRPKFIFSWNSNLYTIEPIQVTIICLDVANGYSEHFVQYVKKVRARFPTHTIIAGNVVTGEMVEELILSGMIKILIRTASKTLKW